MCVCICPIASHPSAVKQCFFGFVYFSSINCFWSVLHTHTHTHVHLFIHPSCFCELLLFLILQYTHTRTHTTLPAHRRASSPCTVWRSMTDRAQIVPEAPRLRVGPTPNVCMYVCMYGYAGGMGSEQQYRICEGSFRGGANSIHTFRIKHW
jgi:hypothetical protein